MLHGIINYSDFDGFVFEEINKVSYIGKPQSGTAMFLAKKVDYLLSNLFDVCDCLVFIENGVEIPKELLNKHAFILCDSQAFDYAYATFVSTNMFACEEDKFKLTRDGYYIGENVSIGDNSIIEPNCVIGSGVIIGDNAILRAGSVIKNSIIGDNFISHEGAKIGTDGFALAKDLNGKWMRIPFFGNVIIGNCVEVGVNSNISRSLAGSTLIGDYTKIDALVYVGHDTIIGDDVKIMAGVIAPGFINVCDDVQIAVNASIRNRIEIGKGAFIGMGAVVTKSICDGVTVIGNPAKEIVK